MNINLVKKTLILIVLMVSPVWYVFRTYVGKIDSTDILTRNLQFLTALSVFGLTTITLYWYIQKGFNQK